MLKKLSIILAVAMAAAAAPALEADDRHHPPANEGEVRKVDRDAKKITIRHGPLQKLDMPAMTMVFQVRDPALLEKANVGDKVLFDAEKANGAYVVTRIESRK